MNEMVHTHISAERPRFSLGLGELWQYRDLVRLLTKKALAVQYKQTVLGPLWVILTPLLSSLVYMMVFGDIAGLGTGGAPRLLFYLSGTALWGFFAACISGNADIFSANAALFGKVYFPRLAVPASNVLTALVRFLIQLALVVAVLLFSLRGGAVSPSWTAVAALPLVLLQLALLGTGLGLLLSALTAKYRDLTALISVLVQLWMFATPVVYPLSSLAKDSPLRTAMLFNPVTAPTELYRSLLLGTGGVPGGWYAWSWLVTLAAALLGLRAFRRKERDFIDTV